LNLILFVYPDEKPIDRIMEIRNNLSGSEVVRTSNKLKEGLYIAEIGQGNSTKQIILWKQ